MTMIAEIEEKALQMSDNDRAKLADRLIASLPPDFTDEDEIAEAVRRSRAMDEDPGRAISHEEFFKFLEDRRK